MNNEKLQKIDADIIKVKAKISEYTARLRDLERLKTETENAGIVTLVRDMDISPNEFTALLQAFRAQSNSTAVTPPTMGDDSTLT